MQYDVRYQIGGEEKTEIVDAESAADAARMIQDQYLTSDDVFELLQVHLIEEDAPTEATPAES
jgi:hypothetical protein